MPTSAGWSTATSSPPTSCSIRAAIRGGGLRLAVRIEDFGKEAGLAGTPPVYESRTGTRRFPASMPGPMS